MDKYAGFSVWATKISLIRVTFHSQNSSSNNNVYDDVDDKELFVMRFILIHNSMPKQTIGE